jgi:hypothetical protein
LASNRSQNGVTYHPASVDTINSFIENGATVGAIIGTDKKEYNVVTYQTDKAGIAYYDLKATGRKEESIKNAEAAAAAKQQQDFNRMMNRAVEKTWWPGLWGPPIGEKPSVQ